MTCPIGQEQVLASGRYRLAPNRSRLMSLNDAKPSFDPIEGSASPSASPPTLVSVPRWPFVAIAKLGGTMVTRPLVACLFGVMLLPVTGALAGARQDARVIMASDPAEQKFQEDWGYASALVSGDTVTLSGVVAGVRPGETD